MDWLVLVVSTVIIVFGFVVAFGAPFLPTKKRQIKTALDLLCLKPGETLLELGCGDGRVPRAAAKRGLSVVGYELNPVLVLVAKLATFRYRARVRIIWGDYWRQDWPEADGIFVFLLDRYMTKLDKKITQSIKKPVKLASFVFKLPGKKPDRALEGVYLYCLKPTSRLP